MKVAFSQKIASTAGKAVSAKGYVSAIDLFIGLGWLSLDRLNDWKRGRVVYLEHILTANLSKLSRAMRELRAWARHSGLRPSWTAYRHKGMPLRFSKSGFIHRDSLQYAFCSCLQGFTI